MRTAEQMGKRVLAVALLLGVSACIADTGKLDACKLLVHSQGVSASATRVLVGDPQAWAELQSHHQSLGSLLALAPKTPQSLDLEYIQERGQALLKSETALVKHFQAVTAMVRLSGELDVLTELLQEGIAKAGGKPKELEIASALIAWSLVIGKSATQLNSYEEPSPEGVFMLSKGLNTYRNLLQELTSLRAANRTAKNPEIMKSLGIADAKLAELHTTAGPAVSLLMERIMARESVDSIATYHRKVKLDLLTQCEKT